MNMHYRFPGRFGGFFLALCLFGFDAPHAAKAVPPSDATMRQLAERLATHTGNAREAAVNQLAQIGLPAVAHVANLIPAKETGASDAAVRVLNRIGMEATIAHCMNSLASSNEQVRYRAANALSMITNRHFGYSPQDTPAKRAQIIARWNQWWVDWQATRQQGPQP